MLLSFSSYDSLELVIDKLRRVVAFAVCTENDDNDKQDCQKAVADNEVIILKDDAPLRLDNAHRKDDHESSCQNDIVVLSKTDIKKRAVREDLKVDVREHRSDHLKRQRYVPIDIEHPYHAHEKDSSNNLEDAVAQRILDLNLAVELGIERLEFLGDHDDNVVHETPDDEVPCGAVPKTCGKPYKKRREVDRHALTDLLA